MQTISHPMHWYAVRTATRQEKRAVDSLKEAGFPVYFPQEIRRKLTATTKDGEGQVIERPLLVGYVLFQSRKLTSEDVDWIGDLEAVSAAVCYREVDGRLCPYPIPTREVALLKAQEEAGAFDRTRRTGYAPAMGDRVRITHGPFIGYVGIVLSLTPTDRRVQLSLDKGTATIHETHLEAFSASEVAA